MDGQKRKDKDGNEYTDVEFLIHELEYLLFKAIAPGGKGGPAIDFARDLYFPKTLGPILAALPTPATREAVGQATIEAIIEQAS